MEKTIAKFQSDLGIGSLIFRVNHRKNGSQSAVTSYEVRQVAGVEEDYVLTRGVERADGHEMTKLDYQDLMAGIGAKQIRQWVITINNPKQELASPTELFYAYEAALLTKQKADPEARFYI